MLTLSLKAGQLLAHGTGTDPNHQHNGKAVTAWHFLTNKGHYYMVDDDSRAIMFDRETNHPIVNIDAP